MPAKARKPAHPKPPARAAVPVLAFTLNGAARELPLTDPDQPLLHVLREAFHLTGTHPGCGKGECGACTVLLDDQPARACQVTLGSVAGRRVTTIEGLGDAAAPHPVQAAFIAEQAAQCGYCTPGMVVEAVALLARVPHPGPAEVKQALAGHLCRCGSHARILRAVRRAAEAGGA